MHLTKRHCLVTLSISICHEADKNASKVKSIMAFGNKLYTDNLPNWIGTVPTIVPFLKCQDTLLHPGFNDLIQNTLFTELPHVTRALLGGLDWQPDSGSADRNWSALANYIGYPLPATQPTLIGHALYIKPHPSQFLVPHVSPCTHRNGERFVCNIVLSKADLLQRSHQHQIITIESVSLVLLLVPNGKKSGK